MLKLREIAVLLSGVASREKEAGEARFMRLSDLSAIKNGLTPALNTGEMPVVARAMAIQKGDIIVGARGAGTEICIADQSLFGAFISLDLYLLRPNPKRVDSNYLAAYLTLPSTQAELASSKQGTGLARLPKEKLEEIVIPLPAISAQRKIGELALSFEQEDHLLRKLRELNSILGRETIARAIRATDTHVPTRST
jgi:hypothetical protein